MTCRNSVLNQEKKEAANLIIFVHSVLAIDTKDQA